MKRDYAIYDVFTSVPLEGNPLAVVFDASGLDDGRMLAIAREFNLSETIFFFPAEKDGHTAKARIFTVGGELPFAGHPTVGGAVALAERRRGEKQSDIDVVQVLEEKIGAVRCAVRLEKEGAGFCEFDLPRLSRQHPIDLEREAVAAALAVGPHEVGFENHVVGCWSAGVPFVMVPLHDVDAVARAKCDATLWTGLAPAIDDRTAFAYVYCRGGRNHEASFHARMFAGHSGIHEDPATGSAVAALSGAIRLHDDLLDGHHTCLIEQGVEMGRPSLIHLHLDVENGAVSHGRIGGQAVKVAEGVLLA